MNYQWTQGCTHIQMPIVLNQGSQNYYDLSATTTTQITLQMRPVYGNVRGVFAALAGSVTSIASPATGGTFYYQFASADVANAGAYELVVVITYGASDVVRTFPATFEIVNAE